MGKRTIPAVLLAVSAVFCAVAYTYLVNPEINAPIGLASFNEPAVRAKVLATAQRLLDNPGTLDVTLSQKTDTESLQRMQELFGFSAATYWTEKEVPIQRWEYKIYTSHRFHGLNPFKQPRPTLEAQVSSSGQILALSIPPKKNPAPAKLDSKQALETSEKLLRVLGVDVGQLTLISTRTGEDQGRQTFDFGWKQPVKGLPGLFYQYTVQLQSGYLTSFMRKPLLASGNEPDLWRDLVFPLLFGAAWFFLALVLFFLFVQKLRRDEVDFKHAQKFGVIAAALTFLRFVSIPERGLLTTILTAVIVSLLAALFFAMLWAVCESFLRQTTSDKLRYVDLLFQGKWNVRDTSRSLLWAGTAGLVLLGLPVLVLLAAKTWRGLSIVLLPVDLQLSNLRFPGGLMGNALLGPLPAVVLIGSIFLGIVYPVVRIRFSRWLACALFCVLFALAVGHLLPFGPPVLALFGAFLIGLFFFSAMEAWGLLAAMALLYVPMAFTKVALLLTAQGSSMLIQGWLSVGVLVAGFFALGYVALFGRPMESVSEYVPEYLARMRERERFARELEIAKGVQERFLPKEKPEIPGFSLATCCIPAMEVGGDYYDYLPLPDGKWLLLLGDISGKGVKAAFYMTLAKGILHAIAFSEGYHTEILRRLNLVFGSQSEPGIFLTLCALVLDPATRDVQILSAGHNPPFLLNEDGAKVLKPRGLVLGLMNDEVFLKSLRDVQMKLEPGDSLVLYTDGVTEAMDRDCQEFDMARLQKSLGKVRDGDPEAVLSAVVKDVEKFQNGAPQADDLTIMVVKCNAS